MTPSGYLVGGWQGQLLWPPSGVPSPHRCKDITQLFGYVSRGLPQHPADCERSTVAARWVATYCSGVANRQSGGKFEQMSSKHHDCSLTFSPWFIAYENWNAWPPLTAKTHIYASHTCAKSVSLAATNKAQCQVSNDAVVHTSTTAQDGGILNLYSTYHKCIPAVWCTEACGMWRIKRPYRLNT